MKEETKEAATPIIAEKLGIKYKEVDGLFYPMWGESNIEDFATVGKYGHRWMSMLMEHDRHLYNQYFLDGTLIVKAKDIEVYCWSCMILWQISLINQENRILIPLIPCG